MTFTCRSCGGLYVSAKARASHERIHTGPSIAERLWSRVDPNGPVPPGALELGPCAIWTGHRVRDGYGRMVVNGKATGVHRISLALALGRPLLPGHDACHRCDNPPCVRQSHLFEASHVANVDDRHVKARDATGAVNGRARLTADDVRAVRLRLAAGASWTTVAGEFRVGKGTIQAIASGRTWQQIS